MATTPGFWREVRAQATAGAILISFGGIASGLGYLIHIVPRQLDKVIENQQLFKGRLDVVERKVNDQDDRLIRLESKR